MARIIRTGRQVLADAERFYGDVAASLKEIPGAAGGDAPRNWGDEQLARLRAIVADVEDELAAVEAQITQTSFPLKQATAGRTRPHASYIHECLREVPYSHRVGLIELVDELLIDFAR